MTRRMETIITITCDGCGGPCTYPASDPPEWTSIEVDVGGQEFLGHAHLRPWCLLVTAFRPMLDAMRGAAMTDMDIAEAMTHVVPAGSLRDVLTDAGRIR